MSSESFYRKESEFLRTAHETTFVSFRYWLKLILCFDDLKYLSTMASLRLYIFDTLFHLIQLCRTYLFLLFNI